MKYLTLLLVLICNSVAAQSYVLYDMQSNQIIESSNQEEVHPVASLTKLVTAMVCIDENSCSESLLERLLVRSDNKVAEEIASKYKGGRTAFIKEMNRKVKSFGLNKTNFLDPSGLSVFNVSTAKEYITVVVEAEKYKLIGSISSKTTIKKKKVTLYNTNIVLMNEVVGIILSKTGFTSHAGRCLALVVQTGDEWTIRKYAIVILGEESPEKRIKQAKRLINMTT